MNFSTFITVLKDRLHLPVSIEERRALIDAQYAAASRAQADKKRRIVDDTRKSAELIRDQLAAFFGESARIRIVGDPEGYIDRLVVSAETDEQCFYGSEPAQALHVYVRRGNEFGMDILWNGDVAPGPLQWAARKAGHLSSGRARSAREFANDLTTWLIEQQRTGSLTI